MTDATGASDDEATGPPPLVQQLGEELSGVSAVERLATMLITAGVLTVGIMLGAHVMAADLLFGVPMPVERVRYYTIMRYGTATAGVALMVGVYLAARTGGAGES